MAFFSKKVEAGPQLRMLPLADLIPNPNQPRQVFAPDELCQLADSISQVGVIQPLTVRRTPDGWELVAGERRLRAAALAGLERVPCLEVQADSNHSALLALVENIQRRDLDFWEEALALDKLISVYGFSQEEAARQIGKSQSAVANKLRLLKLPADVLTVLRDGGCTERHARALLALPGEELQRTAARHVVDQKLNVAQTEHYVEGLLTDKPKRTRPKYLLKDVRLFLNTLNRSLSIMNAAGVKAHCGREETDSEILLTIHIPK